MVQRDADATSDLEDGGLTLWLEQECFFLHHDSGRMTPKGGTSADPAG